METVLKSMVAYYIVS